MTTVALGRRAPVRAKFVRLLQGWLARPLAIVSLFLEVMAEAREMQREAARRYPFHID